MSLELGPVDDVFIPGDYEEGFLAVSGSLQAGIPKVFGVGVSGTAFVSFHGIFSGSWGYSVGGAVSFSTGARYLTTWTKYQRTLDAAGNPDRFPISSIPLLASLPNRNANPEEFAAFVAANRSALMTMFAGYFASF